MVCLSVTVCGFFCLIFCAYDLNFFHIVMFWVVMTKNGAVWCCQCLYVASWDHIFIHFFQARLIGPSMNTLSSSSLFASFNDNNYFSSCRSYFSYFQHNFTSTVLCFWDICIKFYLKSYLLNPLMPASLHFMDPCSLHAACPCAYYGHECIFGYFQFKISMSSALVGIKPQGHFDGLMFVTLGWVCFRVANFTHLKRSKM